ncbi:MAG: LTA synthase family protein [Coriobacteriia bacterium]|nr:LTA synthase family protein [Coriobacteriia bacterium]
MSTYKKPTPKKSKYIRLSVDQSVLLIAVASLLLTLVTLLIQPISAPELWLNFVANKGVNFFLNWFPIFLAMVLLYFTGMGVMPVIMTVSAIVIAMGVTNRFMILLRSDPFMPWDLQLIGEFVGIVGAFSQRDIFAVAGGVFAFLLVAILCSIFVRSKSMGPSPRVTAVGFCLIVALVANFSLYNNMTLNQDLRVINEDWNHRWSAVGRSNSKGFLYSFIYYYNTVRPNMPEGYSLTAVKETIEAGNTDGIESLAGGQHPHIVMVMSESFSDISMSPYFDFRDHVDPLENYQAALEDSIAGDIFVRGFGGWTAETEFDVLTGLNARHFRRAPFAFRLINSEFESLATKLGSIGYRNGFMHPGDAWFYNRQNVYSHIGFEELVFVDDFEDANERGGFVSEADAADRIIQMLDDSIENYPGVPYFNFSVTIENHGPYLGKYENEYPEIAIPNFDTDLNFTQSELNELSNYFEGLRAADEEIGRLIDHFSTLSEPVVFVYFSDHLPMLPLDIYNQLMSDVYEPGSLESLTRLHRVPFFIWYNDAALDLYGIDHISDLEEDDDMFISASFLGAYVLELLNFRNISPFMEHNMELRRRFPLVDYEESFDAQGRSSDSFAESELGILRLYRDWSYFKVFDD